MKIYDKGIYRDLTTEEINEAQRQQEAHELTIEERNRADIDYIAMMLEVEL